MNELYPPKKSKTLAFFLSVLPGVGHMYLGLMNQGTQFMALFFSVILIGNLLNISSFGLIIPIIWFSSLFDCITKASLPQTPVDDDIPFVRWLLKNLGSDSNKMKYVAYLLIIFGAYLLLDQAILPQLEELISYRVKEVLRTSIISIVLIGGGIKLLIGSKKQSSVIENNSKEEQL